jgi:pantetheine-phosphate adenylyltransferase
MRKALYAGSFNPPTNGHLWIIREASTQFDEVIVAIGENPGKIDRFSINDRIKMIADITKNFDNVKISSFIGQFQVDFAESMDCEYIIRGLRDSRDFEYENSLRHMNSSINPFIKTIMITSPKDLLQISSSVVMALSECEGWETEVEEMVTPLVLDYIKIYRVTKEADRLLKRWNSLTNGRRYYNKSTFNNLYSAYLGKNRFYHNLTHISNCLNEFDLIKDKIEKQFVVEMAIWFHDYVYDIKSKTNEEDSINALYDEVELDMKEEIDIDALILATKHNTDELTNDQKYLCDIDLSSLGKSWRLFNYYNKLVEQEYSSLLRKDLLKGRVYFMQGLLNRKRIYYTEFFYNRYEEQARKNIKTYINDMLIELNE